MATPRVCKRLRQPPRAFDPIPFYLELLPAAGTYAAFDFTD